MARVRGSRDYKEKFGEIKNKSAESYQNIGEAKKYFSSMNTSGSTGFLKTSIGDDRDKKTTKRYHEYFFNRWNWICRIKLLRKHTFRRLFSEST